MTSGTNDDYLKRTEVRLEREFHAPVTQVYEAWTRPETMRRWMWAGMGADPWSEVDLRVGGAFRIYTKCAGGRHQGDGWSGMCGLYIRVEERRLTYTLHWDADVGYNMNDRLALDEVVDVTFESAGDRTRIIYVHMGIPDDGVSAKGHHDGTVAAFDLLDTLLSP